MQPPKSALLFLVDSIDEHYINEEDYIVMSALKCNSVNQCRTTAALLSNNFHLMPKWLHKETTELCNVSTGLQESLMNVVAIANNYQMILNRMILYDDAITCE